MLNTIVHRGPDHHAIKILKDKRVGLGHARLSILDLSAASNQPMEDVTRRFQIIFNGEIFNYQELKIELQNLGHVFQTSSDTEVLLSGFIQWGQSIIYKLNGMFSFVIFDLLRDELFAARDRMGEKPFYYYHDENYFIVSSEIKAIIQSGIIKKNINRNALYSFMRTGYNQFEETFISGINRLRPGSILFFNGKNLKIEKYWKPTFTDKLDLSNDLIHEQTRQKLQKSVEKRLLSDVPVGAYLSGGVDSSIVVALAAKLNPKIRTFSTAFDVGPKSTKYNRDCEFAAWNSKRLGLQHELIPIKPEKDFLSIVQAAVYHADEPSCVATNVTMMLAAKHVKQRGYKVILDGTGGDEVFGGYGHYSKELRLMKYRKFIPLLPFKFLGQNLDHPITRHLGVKQNDPEMFLNWGRLFSIGLLKKVCSLDNREEEKNIIKNLKNIQLNEQNLPKHSQEMMLAYDQLMLLPESECMSSDKMAMSQGVEVRSPFLDHEVVNFANSLERRHKFSDKESKICLKAAFDESILPVEIKNRKKDGWFSPFHYWVRDNLHDECLDAMRDLVSLGIFNESVMELDVKKNNIYAPHMWAMLNLKIWMDSYQIRSVK